MRPLAVALVVCSLCGGRAVADDGDGAPAEPVIVEPAPVVPRSLYWSLGVGWLGALTGPDSGPSFEAELFPGGRFGRVGFTAYLRGQQKLDGLDAGLVAAGLTYEAAATRPRLTLNMHAEAGFTYGQSFPVVGGGVKTQLWLKGPFALALNTTGHLLLDGIDSRLQLGTALLVEIAR